MCTVVVEDLILLNAGLRLQKLTDKFLSGGMIIQYGGGRKKTQQNRRKRLCCASRALLQIFLIISKEITNTWNVICEPAGE